MGIWSSISPFFTTHVSQGVTHEVRSYGHTVLDRWRDASGTGGNENHFDVQRHSVERMESSNLMVENFLFTFFSSSLFTFLIILVIFAYISKWSLTDRKAYAGYALGWLIALLLLMVISSLSQQAPENQAGAVQLPESEVQLSTFQVGLSIAVGLTFALLNILFVVGDRFKVLRNALHVTFLTTLILIVMFSLFIVGDLFQRMLGIFIISFGLVTVFLAIIGRQVKRSRQSDNPIVASDTDGTENRAASSPPVVDDPRPSVRQSRIQEIRKHLNQRSKVDPFQ
jgi:cytochrome c biogenesis protein CcdA